MIRILTVSCLVVASLSQTASAEWIVSPTGTWPKAWPEELEPLRATATSFEGGLVNVTRHRIEFTDRESFETAWPHLLKVKTAGAPIILRSSPAKSIGKPMTAGVWIQSPPKAPRSVTLLPRPSGSSFRTDPDYATHSTFIELVVDGSIVDLNRIRLPQDTPIIDRRILGKKQPAVSESTVESLLNE